MNKELLKFIRTLSENDTKSLTGKALKTSEEVGELAKVVLPYENAAGTLHRIVNRRHILDSVADIILCALSVAHDLKFSDEEIESMIAEKSAKWSGLQTKEGNGKFPLPFEIHVTVEKPILDQESLDEFKTSCQLIGVKPIILYLEKEQDVVMVDIMTSSVHYGDNNSAQKEAERIADGLSTKDYKVVRVKIETVPWHPAAPTIGCDWDKVPENSYFESHLRIVTTKDRKDELLEIAKEHNAHLSRNFFKKISDDQYIILMTLREYDEAREPFELIVNNLKDHLESENFLVDKAEIEFALFDTNNDHDNKWIAKFDE